MKAPSPRNKYLKLLGDDCENPRIRKFLLYVHFIPNNMLTKKESARNSQYLPLYNL